jgi:hypothetical protein
MHGRNRHNRHFQGMPRIFRLRRLREGERGLAGAARRPLRSLRGACRRTPSGIDSSEQLEALGGFFAERAGLLPADRGFAAKERRVFSCDGKQNASSGAGGAAKVDAAGAFDSKTGAAPAQILINEKTNETAAMPTPLSNIGSDAEGSIITADAPDAQKEAAKCIKEAKADYLLAIKANAGEIFGDIAVFFDMGAAIEIGTGRVEVLNKDIRSLRWVSKRGSNIEIRDYFMAECPKCLFNASSWEGLKPIAVEAETKVDKFGKTAYTAGFYISSLDGMREAARAARLRWGAGSGPRWHPGRPPWRRQVQGSRKRGSGPAPGIEIHSFKRIAIRHWIL